MPSFGPTNRRDLIRTLKDLGFDGPYSGGDHQHMVRGQTRLRIPNPHQGDIGRGLLVGRALNSTPEATLVSFRLSRARGHTDRSTGSGADVLSARVDGWRNTIGCGSASSVGADWSSVGTWTPTGRRDTNSRLRSWFRERRRDSASASNR